MIEINNISYTYPGETSPAIKGINEVIRGGEITAVIGHTGSGKSTLCEIISGLTAPDSGDVLINGRSVSERAREVGMVFQYPEHQLFAETVYDDIAFGLKNRGIAGEELDSRVRAAASMVGLNDGLLYADPFSLSGGEKRLAALAGIIAPSPKAFILDEPAAGLDPRGRRHIFDILCSLKNGNREIAIVFVTHSMDDAAEFADDVIALKNGAVAARGKPADIFADETLLLSCGLGIPEPLRLANELRALGIDIGSVTNVRDAYNAVMSRLKGGFDFDP